MKDLCEGCKHRTKVQGYFVRCSSPQKLHDLKRFNYVECLPTGKCYEQKRKPK